MTFCVLTVSCTIKWKLAQQAQNLPFNSSKKLGPWPNKFHGSAYREIPLFFISDVDFYGLSIRQSREFTHLFIINKVNLVFYQVYLCGLSMLAWCFFKVSWVVYRC